MRTGNHHEHGKEDEDVRAALRDTFPPVATELPRDLWPTMLRRIDTPAPRIPWYDWALAAGLAAAVLLFPKVLLLFAYHL
jgi:hypothetical protein